MRDGNLSNQTGQYLQITIIIISNSNTVSYSHTGSIIIKSKFQAKEISLLPVIRTNCTSIPRKCHNLPSQSQSVTFLEECWEYHSNIEQFYFYNCVSVGELSSINN